MAKAAGLSEKSVRRIWHQHGLKPHLARTFKVSNDPQFAEKLETIIGLYLNPPEHAIVLCADEKSQIQALDRTQPGLPLKKGRCGTMTHDYKRNGTATLFAAMSTLDGTVISMCDDRHRHQEWLKFLRVIDDVTPPDKELHLIADNYATHKHPKVQKWLARHPRLHADSADAPRMVTIALLKVAAWLGQLPSRWAKPGTGTETFRKSGETFVWTAKFPFSRAMPRTGNVISAALH